MGKDVPTFIDPMDHLFVKVSVIISKIYNYLLLNYVSIYTVLSTTTIIVQTINYYDFGNHLILKYTKMILLNYYYVITVLLYDSRQILGNQYLNKEIENNCKALKFVNIELRIYVCKKGDD